MSKNEKKILIIAGPNGAGKTTFAEEFLPNEASCPEFVNADLIAVGLSPFQSEKVAFSAGRVMLGRIRDLVASGKNFAFETTLSTRVYLRLIPVWQAAGYEVKLCFLKLPSAEFAVRRVAQRVFFGGHNIPVETILRHYSRGWEYLKADYIEVVDGWVIYDALSKPPVIMESGGNCISGKLMEDVTPYNVETGRKGAVKPLDDPGFIGMNAAMKRASEKAIARCLAAGVEPIVRKTEDPREEG